jgi:hypothetical protein
MSLKINRRDSTRGSRWQHQFWDRFVRHAQEFRERLDYMHYNPVRKGLVEKPDQWRWSSYNNFSRNKSVVAACPIEIDYVHLPDSTAHEDIFPTVLVATIGARFVRVNRGPESQRGQPRARRPCLHSVVHPEKSPR